MLVVVEWLKDIKVQDKETGKQQTKKEYVGKEKKKSKQAYIEMFIKNFKCNTRSSKRKRILWMKNGQWINKE